MNPNLDLIRCYPYVRLAQLQEQIYPPSDISKIDLCFGEPQHPIPDFVVDSLQQQTDWIGKYPSCEGSENLRQSIKDWLVKRYGLENKNLNIDENILPVNGSREALFSFAHAMIDNKREDPLILIPNPFYPVYQAATFMANATPIYISSTLENNFIPSFSLVAPDYWRYCQMVYICSPANPTGAVMTKQALWELMALAQKFDFIIASDEGYSEIYHDEDNPPLGLLQAAEEFGNTDYEHCIVFNSLSKRSNVPGLRSGFVAGDKNLIDRFLRYRRLHGNGMPASIQEASALCWQDEVHVFQNRALYREKLDAVLSILKPVLDIRAPEAGYYIWVRTPEGNDEAFAQALYREKNVSVLPGSYLAQSVGGSNPGAPYIRLSLVPPLADCIEAAKRIRAFVQSM